MEGGGGGGGSGSGSKMNEQQEVDDCLAQARVALSLKEFSHAKLYANRVLKSKSKSKSKSNILSISISDQTRFLQVLAIAHVHTAASSEQRHINHDQPIRDWYAILQLGTYARNIYTPDSLSFAYCRLAHLLRPEHCRFAYASDALELVSEAYSVLSDPDRKLAYDDLMRSARMSPSALPLTFWTLCCCCFRVHKYGWIAKGRNVRCPICEKVFVATELPAEPTVVEGTDMYRCDWGFFPLGFTNGCRFQVAEEKAVQKETEMPSPVRRPSKRPRQTARKTVRPVIFRSESERTDADEEDERSDEDEDKDEEDDGGDIYV